MSESLPRCFYVLKLRGNSPAAARIQIRDVRFDLIGQVPDNKPAPLKKLLKEMGVESIGQAQIAQIKAARPATIERITYD